jgi:hypothetical protein
MGTDGDITVDTMAITVTTGIMGIGTVSSF